MKKTIIISIILCFVLFSGPAFAQDYWEIEFEWNQATVDLQNIEKWVLHMYGNGEMQSANIPYTGGEGPFAASSEFEVSVNPGASVEKTFFVTAWSKNGQEAGPSNEESYVFTADVSAPVDFKIKAVIRSGN